jgi:hypothetical protein
VSTEIAGWPAASKPITWGIDVLELGIAIWMAGPFAGFAVGLKTEAEMPQRPANQFMADDKATRGQDTGKMPLAVTDPLQRRCRIAANGRLDNLGQRIELSWTPKMRQLAKVEPCP